MGEPCNGVYNNVFFHNSSCTQSSDSKSSGCQAGILEQLEILAFQHKKLITKSDENGI